MRAVVLCGPGNNGGDGFVVARLLRERGWAVEVFLYGDAEKLPLDARVNYERWCVLGEVKNLCAEVLEVGNFVADAELVIDALFGTGLTRPVELPLVALPREPSVGQCNKLVAVDMPSGICSDSGRQILGEALDESGAAIPADLTVSFHSKKLGHVLAVGPEAAGKSVVVDIGLGYADLGDTTSRKALQAFSGERYIGRVVASLVESASPYLEKWTCEHKFSHGHALILSGGSGKTGAARLAARGALRIGAGLVTLGVPPNAQQEVACQITALMLQRVQDAKAFEVVLEDDRINALCLGPGMGLERARELVPVGLSTKRAAVLDADALSAFAEAPAELFDLLHENVVLTPHGGEFARLFPDIAAKLAEPPTKGPAYSKVDATREASARAGCVVLFKGPDTVIASPNGQCAVNAAVYERAAPWLATAGSGDVLAGFIIGLLARGFAPQQAAETGAWLHVECARAFGPGLIAEDLPEMLPQVLRSLDNDWK